MRFLGWMVSRWILFYMPSSFAFASIQYPLKVPVRQEVIVKSMQLQSDDTYLLTHEIWLVIDIQLIDQDEQELKLLCSLRQFKVADLRKDHAIVSFDSSEAGKTYKDWWCKRCFKRLLSFPFYLRVEKKKGSCHLVIEEDLISHYSQFPHMLNFMKGTLPTLLGQQFILIDKLPTLAASFAKKSPFLAQTTFADQDIDYQVAKCDEDEVVVTYAQKICSHQERGDSLVEGRLQWSRAQGLLFNAHQKFVASQELMKAIDSTLCLELDSTYIYQYTISSQKISELFSDKEDGQKR